MSPVEPSQVAALLGREIDAGFAAALADVGGSRAVVVDRIVARVAGLPDDASPTDPPAEPDWAAIRWQAEVTMHPTGAAAVGGPSEGDPATTPDPGTGDELRRRIAALPTRAVSGIGSHWERTLAGWGHHTVGDLATADVGEVVRTAGTRAYLVLPLLSRARDLVTVWPPLPKATSGHTVAAVAMTDPAPDTPAMHALRAHCLRIVAALDSDVAARLVLP